MRVLVCGGRNYRDSDHVWKTLHELDADTPIDCVVHGAARGADRHGMIWALDNGRLHAPFAADWARHGKAAGALRNSQMLRDGKPDLVVAFPGGRGMADMVRKAQLAGVPVLQVPPQAEGGQG
ncbi:MAG: DUF2493 domain-containing protein [Kiloniellales bacterium]